MEQASNVCRQTYHKDVEYLGYKKCSCASMGYPRRCTNMNLDWYVPADNPENKDFCGDKEIG